MSAHHYFRDFAYCEWFRGYLLLLYFLKQDNHSRWKYDYQISL